MTRKCITLALLITSMAVLGLIYGCSSGNKEGENVTGTTPSPQGNIQSTIISVTIGSPPVVTFTLFDETGTPLDPNTVLQAGGRVRFTLARIGNDGNYQNYIKSSTPSLPGFDSGGTFATVGTGIYTYTFKTDIKDAGQTLNGLVFDPSLTHTVAAQIQRNITAKNGKGFQQAVNPYFNFRPDGQPVTVTREIVAISNCNECHGNLGLHGGGRREIVLCILCHNKGVTDPDTGNSIDFKSLIHKIHMGDTLPSNAAGGNFTIGSSDFGDVTYPFLSGDDFISGTPAKCVKCHRKGRTLPAGISVRT
jgi:OmcA/MtrC family decaheme c-type cytochrome